MLSKLTNVHLFIEWGIFFSMKFLIAEFKYDILLTFQKCDRKFIIISVWIMNFLAKPEINNQNIQSVIETPQNIHYVQSHLTCDGMG